MGRTVGGASVALGRMRRSSDSLRVLRRGLPEYESYLGFEDRELDELVEA